jgi:hypothetical protein
VSPAEPQTGAHKRQAELKRQGPVEGGFGEPVFSDQNLVGVNASSLRDARDTPKQLDRDAMPGQKGDLARQGRTVI